MTESVKGFVLFESSGILIPDFLTFLSSGFGWFQIFKAGWICGQYVLRLRKLADIGFSLVEYMEGIEGVLNRIHQQKICRVGMV